MPGSDLKDIHIAKSVSELNKLAEIVTHATNARLWVLVYSHLSHSGIDKFHN